MIGQNRKILGSCRFKSNFNLIVPTVDKGTNTVSNYFSASATIGQKLKTTQMRRRIWAIWPSNIVPNCGFEIDENLKFFFNFFLQITIFLWMDIFFFWTFPPIQILIFLFLSLFSYHSFKQSNNYIGKDSIWLQIK